MVLLSPKKKKKVAMMQLYTSPVKLSNPQRFITINCIFLLFFHTLLLLSFIFSVSVLQLWPQSLNSRRQKSYPGNILVHNVPAFSTSGLLYMALVSLQLCTVLDSSSLLSFLGTCSVMAALFIQSHVKAFCTKNKNKTKKKTKNSRASRTVPEKCPEFLQKRKESL